MDKHGGVKDGNNNSTNLEIISTMFVERTPGEALLRALQQKENEIAQEWGFRMKLIEKNVLKLENILIKRDPFKGTPCGRDDCMIC